MVDAAQVENLTYVAMGQDHTNLGFFDQHPNEVIVSRVAWMNDFDGDSLLESTQALSFGDIHLRHTAHGDAFQQGIRPERAGEIKRIVEQAHSKGLEFISKSVLHITVLLF